MGGRFSVLALLAMVATGVLPETSSAQSAALPSSDPQTAVFSPPASPNLDGVQAQAAPRRGVRPEGLEAEQLVADARRLSPTVRRQIAELERSDLLVYLEVRLLPSSRTGHLGLLGSVRGVRRLKIEIDGRNRGSARIMWLGHELQHAIEIASATDVADEAGFIRLYRRIGRRSFTDPGSFETAGAVRVGNQVMAELQPAQGVLMAAGSPR